MRNIEQVSDTPKTGQDVFIVKRQTQAGVSLKIQKAVFTHSDHPSCAKGELRYCVRYYQINTGKPGSISYAVPPERVHTTEEGAKAEANQWIDDQIKKLIAAKF